ncbi:MAG: hypothetical protein U5L96_09045 [Owenweeksia sp.]|nr:hypothetical protein [Owenweeksia sp.]
MIYPISYIWDRYKLPFTLILSLLLAGSDLSGQLQINSTPAMVGDSLFLCAPSNNTVSFSASGTTSGNVYAWRFGTGTPNSAAGTGPHSVSFNSYSRVEAI